MNKLKQVSSDHHQMSLAGGPRSDVQGQGEGALYSEVQCIIGNGHMAMDRQTHTYENITFPQLR